MGDFIRFYSLELQWNIKAETFCLCVFRCCCGDFNAIQASRGYPWRTSSLGYAWVNTSTLTAASSFRFKDKNKPGSQHFCWVLSVVANSRFPVHTKGTPVSAKRWTPYVTFWNTIASAGHCTSARTRYQFRRRRTQIDSRSFGESVVIRGFAVERVLWLRGDCVRARQDGDGTRFPVCGCISRLPAILLRELLPFAAVDAREP